jgi:hypothetical protein
MLSAPEQVAVYTPNNQTVWLKKGFIGGKAPSALPGAFLLHKNNTAIIKDVDFPANDSRNVGGVTTQEQAAKLVKEATEPFAIWDAPNSHLYFKKSWPGSPVAVAKPNCWLVDKDILEDQSVELTVIEGVDCWGNDTRHVGGVETLEDAKKLMRAAVEPLSVYVVSSKTLWFKKGFVGGKPIAKLPGAYLIHKSDPIAIKDVDLWGNDSRNVGSVSTLEQASKLVKEASEPLAIWDAAGGVLYFKKSWVGVAAATAKPNCWLVDKNSSDSSASKPVHLTVIQGVDAWGNDSRNITGVNTLEDAKQLMSSAPEPLAVYVSQSKTLWLKKGFVGTRPISKAAGLYLIHKSDHVEGQANVEGTGIVHDLDFPGQNDARNVGGVSTLEQASKLIKESAEPLAIWDSPNSRLYFKKSWAGCSAATTKAGCWLVDRDV